MGTGEAGTEASQQVDIRTPGGRGDAAGPGRLLVLEGVGEGDRPLSAFGVNRGKLGVLQREPLGCGVLAGDPA